MQQIKRKKDGKGKYKLGRDIEAKQYTNNYGSGFYKNLSQDLKNEMPGVKGFSPTNLKYMSYFYKLYAPLAANRQQAADDFEEDLYKTDIQRVGDKKQNRLHGVDDFKILFFIPWFHHQRIIDKCKDDVNKENLSIAEMSGKKFYDSTITIDIQQIAANKQNRQQPVDDFKLLVPNSSSACGSGTG
ncbi:MAG TPA: DUF1016 N-terminal domain-containing protein [Prevotella sp.]|nr:DUF1016 N-terminal domain-containing protein [Prevotella sp.]